MNNAKRNFITKALWQGLLIILIAAALSLTINHFRQAGLPLVADRPPPSSEAVLSGSKSGGAPAISIEAARALFLTNGAVFVDARPEEVYSSGHIKGALNLPPDNMEESLPALESQIPPGSLIITYCDGLDCPLGEEAALELLAKGYSNVQVLANGWSAWQDAGLPTER